MKRPTAGSLPASDLSDRASLSDRARHCCEDRPAALRKSLFAILENRKDETSLRTAKLIRGLYEDWCGLDERIETVTTEIEELSQTESKCRQLMSIPGVGPLHLSGRARKKGFTA
jgi:transposase